jgi:deoxyribodipyrimidine photo-lyase
VTVALALFTRDLGVHDNPVLYAAAQSADCVVALFVLDERILASGYSRPNRARSLADSLADLRQADRLDPEGDYVRRYLPELANVAGAAAAQRFPASAGECVTVFELCDTLTTADACAGRCDRLAGRRSP